MTTCTTESKPKNRTTRTVTYDSSRTRSEGDYRATTDPQQHNVEAQEEEPKSSTHLGITIRWGVRAAGAARTNWGGEGR
ncbi:hypothetical protein HEB94_002403 [Actinopolymorpha pittospori]|uniref:Uncharacterized protein n=1 Tax=Actinopolymorpha pittospori TaxID=648752 RepID=A0A927MRI2_9ACTN|nr:hypothetical protein [Actinopolymorpha pittospori]